MRVEIRNELANLGAEILRYLLSELQRPGRPFWGLEQDKPDDRVRISRAAAQLIESLSWLDCQEETYLGLEDLVDFLTQQAIEDPEQIIAQQSAFTASRLKSILQYCAYERASFCEHVAMSKSLSYLVEERLSRPGTAIDNQLCAADLFGYFLSLVDVAPYVQKIDVDGLRGRVGREYRKLLTAIKKWKNALRDPDDQPKAYSFALWLLFAGGSYGARNEALRSTELLVDLERLSGATEAYDQRFRVGQSYHPTRFNKIVYPKLILSWVSRKMPSLEDRFRLDAFYRWLIPTSRHLLERREDPYQLGLVLKACVAAAKDDVRQRFRELNLEASVRVLHDERTRQSEAARSLLTKVIRDRLQVTIDDPKRLTGGWSPAQVWRVSGKYCLPLSAADSQNDLSRPFSFVVKMGERARFTEAARRYQALSIDGRRLFPRHDPQPSLISGEDGAALFYLIMEELRDYEPLARRISSKVPSDETAAVAKRDLVAAITIGVEAVGALHQVAIPEQPEEFSRPKLTEIKIAEMFSLLENIGSRNPRLRQLLHKPVRSVRSGRDEDLSNPRNSLNLALNGVGKVVSAKGRRSRHSLTHGDCHGNNIMLPVRDNSRALFIDIDGLGVEDYLQDYADLIAHVCLSLDLEKFPVERIALDVSQEAGRVRVECAYDNAPYLEVQKRVFPTLLSAAVAEAELRKDAGAVPRLGLLIARRVLFIASKAPHEAKAAVLLLRALGFLENVCNLLRRSAPVGIPCTALDAADVQGFVEP